MADVTAYRETEAIARLAELEEKTEDELHALFSGGRLPRFEEIDGTTRGSLLQWDDENASPLLQLSVTLLFESPLGRWTGKDFVHEFSEDENGSGVNLFDNRIRPRRYGFDTYPKNAYTDGESCLALDYGRFRSPMSGLVDDVRMVDEGVLLGQMYYKHPFASERSYRGYFGLCVLD